MNDGCSIYEIYIFHPDIIYEFGIFHVGLIHLSPMTLIHFTGDWSQVRDLSSVKFIYAAVDGFIIYKFDTFDW